MVVSLGTRTVSVTLPEALDSDAYAALEAHGAPMLDWPLVRRAILDNGGIGPSPDWPRDWYPADLYREHGPSPDVVARETFITSVGGAGVTPWGDDADDAAMFAYVQRSYAEWRAAPESARYSVEESPRMRAARVAGIARRAASKPRTAPAAPRKRAPGTRSFVELVAELQLKHGAEVDLSGLRAEYVSAYETGERVTVERDGRSYRGTVGATRGPRPRFVLLLSMDL